MQREFSKFNDVSLYTPDYPSVHTGGMRNMIPGSQFIIGQTHKLVLSALVLFLVKYDARYTS